MQISTKYDKVLKPLLEISTEHIYVLYIPSGNNNITLFYPQRITNQKPTKSTINTDVYKRQVQFTVHW